MENEKKELTIRAKLSEVDRARKFITNELDQRNCPEDVAGRIELALEEMLVNVVCYAYPEGEGEVTVTVFFPKSDVIRIEITDKGIPYDPTKRSDPDVAKPLNQRKKGGLGIFMTKQIMDEMTYDHKDGLNRTILIKQFK